MGQWAGLIWLSEKIRNDIPIKIFNQGDLYRDFTYIDDIVEGIYRIVNNPPVPNEEGDLYKIYNIGNNKPVKLMYFIETLENILGKKAERILSHTAWRCISDICRYFRFNSGLWF